MKMDPTPDPAAEQHRRDSLIIAAAVAALCGERAAIRQIRSMPGNGAGAWTREGRRAIQGSHGTSAPLIRPVSQLTWGDV